MAYGHDIDSMLGAVNAASAKALHTWIALITFGTYLAIAVGSITHRDLFFESPVNLPLLNVPLPLVAFFVVAPFLFLIMHLYLLMSLYILGCRVQLFEQRLPHQVPVTADQTRLRAQLDPFLILQKLAGPVQGMVPRVLLSLTVWITVIAGPVVLILAFQIQFLPYHLEWVTWWHRILIFLDVVMLGLLWPAAIHESSRIWPAVVSPFRSAKALLSGKADRARLRPASAPWAVVSLIVVILFVVPFSVLLATVPDGLVERRIMWVGLERTDRGVAEPAVGGDHYEEAAADRWWWLRPSCWFGLTERDGRIMWCPTAKLFEGNLNSDTGKLDSWFSRSLVLPDAPLARLGENTSVTAEPLVLRSRDFRHAILSRADLRNAQLFAPNLRGAQLDRAQLQGASLGASPTIADLQGAVLDYAHMQGAELSGAMLQGASLQSTNLEGASLPGAKLQGARLKLANLRGADLDVAHLQGAYLMYAELQGASLRGAKLQGAFLWGAKLQLATLTNAQLQGASFDAASLWRGHLEGADAHLVSCQDASFDPLDGETIAQMGVAELAQGSLLKQASNEDIYVAWEKTGCLDYEPSRLDGELAEFLVSELVCDAGRIIGSNAPVAIGLLTRMEQEQEQEKEKDKDKNKESRPYHWTVALSVLNDGRCKAVRDVLPAADLAKFRAFADHAPPGSVASQPAKAPSPDAASGATDGDFAP